MPGLRTVPSRISMAREIVGSRFFYAAGPAGTVSRCGNNASLISQVAEFQKQDGLWSWRSSAPRLAPR